MSTRTPILILLISVILLALVSPVMGYYTWTVTNVDKTDLTFKSSYTYAMRNNFQNIKINPSNDVPYISYLLTSGDSDPQSLALAYWDGTLWDTSTLLSQGTCMYGRWSASNDLDFSRSNFPWIVYDNCTIPEGYQPYTWLYSFDGVSWSGHLLQNWIEIAYGGGLSMGINQTGNMSITFDWGPSTGYDSWDESLVESGYIHPVFHTQSATVSFNQSGLPGIFSGYGRLDYTEWTGAVACGGICADGWQQTLGIIPGGPYYPGESSLKINRTDNVTIAYYDRDRSDLNYAVRDGPFSGDVVWTATTIDSTGDVGILPSLATDSSDYPHIAYTDYTNGAVKHAWKDGSGWHNETVASASGYGYSIFPKIAIDSNDTIYISYYNSTDGYLKVAFALAPPPGQTGSISISSDPPGATIYLDGINKGVTPQSLENIPFGFHAVKLTLGGYKDWTEYVELTAASPSASINAVLTILPVMPAGTAILLVGGENITDNPFGWQVEVPYNDTWKSTDYGATWTLVNTSAGWEARTLNPVLLSTGNGCITLLGGSNNYEYGYWPPNFYDVNDIWTSSDGGDVWTLVNASPEWSPRHWASAVIQHDDDMFMIGTDLCISNGLCPPGIPCNLGDVWRSTDKGNTWQIQDDIAPWNPPPFTGRAGSSVVVMPDDSLVLMGGESDCAFNVFSDVWRSNDDGVTWTQMNASSGWEPRMAASAVVLDCGDIVLTGGSDFWPNHFNDTWRSSDYGATWTEINPSSGWGERMGHSMVVLPDDSIILTGGSNYHTLDEYNDTWRSTDGGYTWDLMNASSGWSERFGHGMVALVGPRVQTGSISIGSVPSGATIYLDDVYQGVTPKSLENIPFGVHVVKLTLDNYEDWTENVELTAASPSGSVNAALNPVPPTYSATIVGKYNPPDMDMDAKAILIWGALHGLSPSMDPVFIHCSTNNDALTLKCTGQTVTKSDFGTDGGGLNNAILHYHWGHGERVWGGLWGSRIILTDDFVYPGDVSGKWNNKNKWVVIDACEVLSDRSWWNALGTSHAVLGFETVKPASAELATNFVRQATGGETIYDSYRQATTDAYSENADIPYDVRAIAIFKNQYQMDHDYLPGKGTGVAPDSSPSDIPVFECWHTQTGEPC